MSIKPDPTSQAERDQMVAFTVSTLSKGIAAQRELRTKIEADKGHIDAYRITRDVAGKLYQKFDRKQLAILLSAAMDRLAQLPDLELPPELIGLDFDPEEDSK